MASIVESMMTQLSSGDNLSAISNSVGGDSKAVNAALSLGLPLLLSSMSKTASTPGGADTLTKMLAQTGGSSPMDNIGSFLSSPAAAGGSGIVNSLLGNQLIMVQNAIAQKTGLPPAVVGKVLSIAAPMLIAYVGKRFTQQKMDTAGLAKLLGEESKLALKSSPDAAKLAEQVIGPQKSAGGLGELLKKLIKG